MKNISLAILCVGLCACNVYLKVHGKEGDLGIGFFAILSAILVVI